MIFETIIVLAYEGILILDNNNLSSFVKLLEIFERKPL